MKKPLIFLTLLVIPFLVQAQAQAIQVGDYSFEYTESFPVDTDNNGVNDRTSYYNGESLVLTAYDTDENGSPELWFVYDGEDNVKMELEDTTADGVPDEVVEIGDNEEVLTRSSKGGESLWGEPLTWILIIVVLGLVGIVARFKLKPKSQSSQ